MPDPNKAEPNDEIGEIKLDDIVATIAKCCPDCSPEEIIRRVIEVLSLKSPSEAD